MTLQNIDFDRKNLTIMGVRFPNVASLESAASAIASNMYEGFHPTPKLIEIYRDFRLGLISPNDLAKRIKNAI